MPNTITILTYPQVSLSLALLMEDLLRRADALTGNPGSLFLPRLCGFHALENGGLKLQPEAPPSTTDWILVPPFGEGFSGTVESLDQETAWVQELFSQGTGVASACLGALIPALAGILDDREATTHWRWTEWARQKFPLVKWRPREMLCDTGAAVTAGGYLAAIDLSLHLISRLGGTALAADLSRRVLADTLRQKQSVYAQKLTWAPGPASPFAGLESWVDRHLDQPFTIEDLRSPFPMSARNFHRKFTAELGMTPIQYVQLKRIEKAQVLLRDTNLSLEQILDQVGVTDPVSFRRIFERELGLSPSRYRRQFQEKK